ncbi:MAG: ABC transporter ATP-binding protein [Clostridia bacterium]|nr:ABC transporter ATP-binding protein [Clostridia bacterium]
MSFKKNAVNDNTAKKQKADFNKSWKKLIIYCKKHLTSILIATILAIVGTVLTLIGPNKIGELTNIIADGMMTQIDMTAVLGIAIVLVIIYSVSSFSTFFEGYIMAGVTQKVSKRLRKDISHKINKLPLKYLDSRSTGDVLSRVTNDVDSIAQTLNNSVSSLIAGITLILGCILMMFVTNWVMAICAILSSLMGFILMGLIMSKSQKYFNSQQKSLGELNGHIEENYTGHDIVRAYNGQEYGKTKFNKINDTLFKSAWKSQFFSGLMMPLMSFVGNFGFLVVCVVGAVLFANGYIEIGVIIAFMIYVRLFMQPLSTIAQSATNLQATGAASLRVFEFLGEQELEDEKYKDLQLKIETIKGNVEFKNVKFGYSEDKLVIKNFSGIVKAGQKVAIVGPTGAGKTTLVNLLMRFYEVNEGDILIDGISTRDLTRENVHNIFGMVLQDTWLFEATVKENIIYSKSGVSDQQVFDACKEIGIDHFIQTLPNGYDTVLDDSTSVSAGQKQLLTIARAMIQNSPMLILDEATSSVDTRTEILIQKAMDKITKNRTSFVIAHRLSTIKNADLILVMKDGDVIEKGSHKQLMAQDGFYKDLYDSQFTNKGAEIVEI